MSIMTPEQEICWLAGFYEGEGCISASIHDLNGYDRRRIVFVLPQNDESNAALVLAKSILIKNGIAEERIKARLARKAHKDNRGYYRKNLYEIRIEKYSEVEKAALLLWPYLTPVRRGQIQEAFLIYCEDFIPKHKIEERYSEICDMSLVSGWEGHRRFDFGQD